MFEDVWRCLKICDGNLRIFEYFVYDLICLKVFKI